MDEFNKGAYATVVVKGMDAKGIEKIEDKIENVEHVTDIISYNSMVGAEVPTEIIPSKYRSYFENQESGCTGTVYGFFPCTGILYVKYRYGDCLQLRL